MDLTALDLTKGNLEVLDGAVWDETTQWPPGLRNPIKARSKQIEPGRYRVHDGGTERDPHEAAHT
ncbi:hypothetical protein [Actinomadura nitritigenes]|uniref:hypothetical protein n=1 Tax=Actinomadura nitritigenes TaxID=134602 RepID=UPI003D94BA5F